SRDRVGLFFNTKFLERSAEMETIKNYILELFSYSRIEWGIGGIIGFIGGVLSAMVGGFDLLMQLLLATMALDILTGFLNSKKNLNTSSDTGIKGINRKIGIW